jgi:hypothetical protein
METRLTTQWTPLLTFIADLKLGVKPWLASPPASQRPQPAPDFRVIDLEAVQRVVDEIVKKNGAKEKAEVRDEGGELIKMELDADEEPDEDGREQGWKVTEVWEPPKGEIKVEEG